MRVLWLTLLWSFLAAAPLTWGLVPAEAWAEDNAACASDCQKKKKKKKRKKKRRKKKSKSKSKKGASKADEPEEPSVEELALESAPTVERKESKLTPGSRSRWSNRGAMEPIETVVPVQAPLPERAKPKPVGVETPGQRLLAPSDQLSAHIGTYISHLQTNRQVNDIDLLRTRVSFDYDRIADTELGVHFDGEYRPKLNELTFRPTDYRITAAYVNYGFRDLRQRGGQDWGLAVGRVSVPEAGYAIADGAAFRYRFSPDIKAGAFMGFAPNPYQYNWTFGRSEGFSTNYMTGGLFGTFRFDRVYASVATALYYANDVSLYARDENEELVFQGKASGLDRFYAFLDVGWTISRDLVLFGKGWFDYLNDDVLTNQLVQDAEIVASWQPTRELDVRASFGRFSTWLYPLALRSSFGPPNPNINAPVVVDDQDLPIADFQTQYQRAIYTTARLRAGVELMEVLEAYTVVDTYIRDTIDASAPFAQFRVLPQFGVRYRDPEIVDAEGRFTVIVDDQSINKLVLYMMVGRGVGHPMIGDARLDLDLRGFLGGDIPALDGGLTASYTLPRAWLPGRLMLRGMLRYFKEEVAIERPLGQGSIFDPTVELPLVPVQESYYGWAGVDWRL